MRRRSLKVAAPVALFIVAALALGACGSSGTETAKPPPPPVSAATADHLAKLSNRVASQLDAGDTCGAAYAADQLKDAVEGSDLPATLRPGVTAVAGDLVDEVNCPPPPPQPKPEDKKHGGGGPGEDHHGGGQGEDHHKGSTPPGHSHKGAFVPPGQAKLKGEGH